VDNSGGDCFEGLSSGEKAKLLFNNSDVTVTPPPEQWRVKNLKSHKGSPVPYGDIPSLHRVTSILL